MTVSDSPARASLVAGAQHAVCEACTSKMSHTSTTLVVQHPRGGTVELAVCDWCVQAFRRLAAVSGGLVAFAQAEPTRLRPAAPRNAAQASRPPGPAVMVAELVQTIVDRSGTEYLPRVFGRQRADGTWEGWIEFVALGAQTVLRTPRETTQSKHADLVYWSSGLQGTYLQGAFARARRASSAA